MKTIIFIVILVVLFFIFKKKIHAFMFSMVKKFKGVDEKKGTENTHTVFPIKGIVGYLDLTLQIEETGEGSLIVTPIKPRKKSVKLEE